MPIVVLLLLVCLLIRYINHVGSRLRVLRLSLHVGEGSVGRDTHILERVVKEVATVEVEVLAWLGHRKENFRLIIYELIVLFKAINL